MAKCCLCGKEEADSHCERTGRDVHAECLASAYADMRNNGVNEWTEAHDEIIDMARSVFGV